MALCLERCLESDYAFGSSTRADSPIDRELPRLTAHERALYDDLRADRFGRHVRLEQERIGFAWVGDALATGTQPNCMLPAAINGPDATSLLLRESTFTFSPSRVRAPSN